MTKHTINVIIDCVMTIHFSARCSLRRDTALALGVGLFLFAVYLLSYRGGFHSVDEVSMFAVTESLVKFGRLNTDQIAWTQWTTTQREAQGFFGVDRHVYSKKGLALSLAMAPLYWLGLIVPGLGMLQTASLLNSIVTAITAGLLFCLVRRLGYGERVAVGVALLYGLATIAWVYSKYLFSEPLAGLLLLATTYFLVTFRQEGGLWRAALAGLLTGLAVATRANNLFLAPVFGVYLVASSKVAGSKVAGNTGYSLLPTPGPNYGPLHCSLLPVTCYLLGLIPPALLLMGYNWVRAGNPLQTGYDLTLFSPNLLLGLYKLLFSPLRGLFIYSPLLILSVPGCIWLWRCRRMEAALTIGLAGVTILLFSAWTSGEGLSWGSRFLVPVVPLLCLPLAPVLDRALVRSKVVGVLLGGLGIVSGAIQFLGVAVNPWIYLARLQADFGGEFFLENTPALADFRYTQVIGQLRSWSLANSDVVWWQPWGFDGLSFGAMGLLVGVSGFWLWRLLCSSHRIDSPQPLAPSPYLILLLAALTSLFVLRRAYRSDRQFGPFDDGYTQALATVAAQPAPAASRLCGAAPCGPGVGPGEVIVSVAPYHYHVPMNRFKARIPIIGFARQTAPLPETVLPLLRDSVVGQNTWLITIGLPPAAPDNAAEQWLALNAFKASDEWFPNDVRLVHYGVYRPMVTHLIDTRLGEELRLVRVNTAESLQPGQTLPVEFVWLPLNQPGANYNLFLQLLTTDGVLVAQHDGPPDGGYTPTSTWPPGKEVIDRHGLALPADLPPGNYRLIAGLYDPTTNERLPVDRGGDFVEIGRIALQSSGQ